ncbi:hypothetical protein BCT27_19925 [Enterovibrio norvegicus]|uniref:Glycosyl transferase n=1 Tax=Enterovibrio norvegicus TaxID=188144 RepID=A0A2N7LEQ8_9GAMM|nr:hypothetical protein BCT69_12665 [Enterovibrio norvegicus]PMN69892.1 hypothetical protein BCT27_19925 [Enterovibrio norvegicus]PMN93798.1 hypothetical protein BCT23_11925 [Enterovibrio norvegicus]
MHDVYLVIESLGQQTVKANRIVLWLDENEYSLETIPLLLKNQMDRGLDVRFYPNIRSYKKLVPSLKLFPQADIITVDDDILYPHDLIELLLRGRHLEPDSIVGVRAHTIAIDKDGVKPYRKWKYESSFEENGRNTFLTSGAGTLFPAGMLNEEFCNEKSFMELCPSADDIWINMMCIKHDIKRSKIRDDRDFSLRFLQIKDHQDIALNNENVHSNGNDLQLSKILEKYDIEI